MMKKVTLLMLLCCAFMLPAFAQFSYVPVTGYNADIVADGTIGVPTLTTNAAADVAVPPYVFVSPTFGFGSTLCATTGNALPATNSITSSNATNNTGITYTLQPYTGNNVLQMLNNASGTLTLTTPINAAKLYIVCLGGSGAVTFTAVVNFTDATSQTITNSPAAPDWCGGANTYKLTSQQYYRINNNATSCSGAGCQYLYEIPITLSGAAMFKNIASVTFTNNTAGTVFSIFAMGAQAPCAAPAAQPTALVLTPNSTSQISGSFTAATGSPAGYVVVRYPQGSAVTVPDHGTTYTVGQSLGLGTVVLSGATTTFTDAGLSGATNYTYYVYAYSTGTTCGGPVYNLVSPLTATQSTSPCGTMSGTIPVGPGLLNTPASGFTSITNAMTYINANGLGGNTVLALQSGYVGTSANETFPITFPLNPCVSSSRTLTIRPATGVSGLSITNTSDGAPVIDFSGCTYVTIDGVNNDLTISNTSVASTANTSTIRFINDARNNAILNCTVLGSSTGTLATNNGTIYFSTGTVTGNDNNTIMGCKIGAATATTLPSKGIYALGSTTNATIANSNILLVNNEISDFFLTSGCAGIYALGGNTDWTITNNKVFQTATRTFTATGTLFGIYFSSTGFGQNIQITANTIGYASGNATGTMTLDGAVASLFQGIYFNSWTSGTLANNVSGNIISDISFNSTSSSSNGSFIGILNAITTAGTVTVNINGNQIKNITALTTTGAVYGIHWGTAATISLSGNTVNNISRNGNGNLYGIQSAGSSVNETVSGNTISNLTATSAGASTIYGIFQNTTAGTKVFQNNQVFNLSGANGTTISGLRIQQGTTIDISGNNVNALSSTGGTAGTVSGIFFGASGTLYNVYKNKIYNLSMTSAGGVTNGIFNNGSAGNIYNNLIGELSSTAFTSTTAPYMGVAGINIGSGNSNIYNNTVRISAVTSSGANFSAMGIFASTTPTVLLQNNLIVNLAVPTGSGKAVAYQRSSTTLTTYATASNNNSFFAGTPGVNNVISWDGTNVYQDLAAYKTAMVNRDQYTLSANPTFISILPTDATYLHIPAGGSNILESAGTNVALFTTDYDGQNRPGPTGSVNGGAIYYDIGADEFDAVPAFSCTQPAPGNTVATPATICLGGSSVLSAQNPTPGNAVLYKWFSSTDGTTYVEVAGATNATYTATPLVPTYYKVTITCGGTLTATSTPVLLTFTNLVTATTPGQRCGTGTVSLGATASSGTLKWYTDAIGGVPLGSGTPYVTPVISASTTYYVTAESPVTGVANFGTGTTLTSNTGYPTAFGNRWYQDWSQMVYTAAELTASGLRPGNITALQFRIDAIGSSASVSNYTISLGSTALTTLSSFVTTGINPVYGPATYTSAPGLNTITFTTPYNWDGVSNIIVDIRGTGINSTYNATTYYTATAGNTAIGTYSSTNNAAFYTSNPAVTPTNQRFNINFFGQVACTSPRIPVAATVNTAPAFTITANQTICNAAITPLTVTSTVASYNSYVWTPITNLYTDAAATVPYVAGASASTVFLKSSTAGDAVYTVNASNSTTQCAAIATTTQTVLPSAVTATATPASLCVSGITTFSLTPATGYGAGTFQWQSSANNALFVDVNGATGATYTTPVTTISTYYRAAIKNSAGSFCINSTSDTARVYNPAITNTTPATRCGPGTLTLGASGNDGTLKWYSTLTGGTSIGTGTSFTTPSISATTTYYVGSETTPNVEAAVGTATTLTGATTQPTAFCNRWKQYWCQMVYTAAELQAAGLTAGNITAITFNITTLGDASNVTNFTVAVGTAPSTLTAFTTTGLTPVYGPSTYNHAVGANTITFTTPYYWDGVSNILLDMRQTGADAINNAITYYTATTTNTCATATTSSATPELATTNPTPTLSTQRLNTIFSQTGCMSPRTPVVATVNPLPTPTITPAGPVNLCTGATTTLTGGGGGTYQWRNAAGNIAGATNSTYTTGTAGTYRVIVTTPATGCKDTSAAVTVNVNTAPIVNLGNDTTFCSGNTLTLNAGNAGSTYLWNNATTLQTRNVTTTGTYWVRVTNASLCQKTDTINVTVNPTPVVNLGNDTNLCQGVNFVLNSGNPGATRLWDNGATTQTRTVNTTGTYYVRVTNGFNCTARDTIVTTFYTMPVVNLGNNQDVCVGVTTTLDAGNPGETYLWDNGATTQTRSVNTTGTYFVTVKNFANCQASDTVTINYHALPVVNLGNDTTFCYGKTLTLNAGNPGSSYLWNTNSTAQTIPVSATGTYSVVVTNAFDCIGTDAINIIVKDPPSATINAVHGNPATYTFNLLNMQYVSGATWNFGDGSPTATGYTVQHTYANNGIYTVTVTLQGECEDNVQTIRTVDVFDAQGTGIDQVDNSKELVLYPNPARDVVIIENKNNFKMKQVILYSVVGQVISTHVADSPDKHKLNTTGLASGIYTVRIETDKGTVIRKFEIMK